MKKKYGIFYKDHGKWKGPWLNRHWSKDSLDDLSDAIKQCKIQLKCKVKVKEQKYINVDLDI